jgi:hypothetical protein
MKPLSSGRNQLLVAGTVYAFLLVIAYALLSFYQLPGDWNRILQNSITVLSALTCAVTLTVIVSFYQPGEPPRLIWIYFAIALWMWTLGEIVWAGYNLVMIEVPDTTFGDAFYLAGYIFFTFALAIQYRLVLFTPGRKVFWIAAGIWLATIVVTLLTMFIFQSESYVSEFLSYFYPIGDFVIGVAALVLVVTFRGGALARPWISLLAFVLSDSLYLWAVTQDVYSWQGFGGDATQQWITMGVDTIYIVAYMIMFWGVLQQYLTLRFGAVVSERDTKPVRVRAVN